MKIKKTKISKADKSLIRDTVNSIAAMRNSSASDEEMEGLTRSNGNSNGDGNQARSNDGYWKALAFVMFGIVVLFATDTIEFKKLGLKKNNESGNEDAADAIFGGHVETKVPEPALPMVEAAPTEPKNRSLSAGRRTYETRGQPMSDEDRKAMEDKWGKWSLEADAKDRPTDDYYIAHPNRDVPFDKFPDNAWQKDKDWLSKFLPESIELVDRATNAILEEYGQPTDGTSDLFHVEKHEQWIANMEKEHCKSQVGCTTVKSYENLKRRLLHAVMTEDNFIFAMGGHSAAAAHGNHFTQSYTLQVQWILEGVFSRLGVRHQARNLGLGGLGTVQTGLATKQMIGHDVDILMWDSGTF